MTSNNKYLNDADAFPDIKVVPQDQKMRQVILLRAEEIMLDCDRSQMLTRDELERRGREVLQQLDFSEAYLGFTMVVINNSFWRAQYAGVPFERRLLLLPRCLSDQTICTGSTDLDGLHCAGCGECIIASLTERALAMGYRVIVAEGTSSALLSLIEDGIDAICGVACLDSLEKSFTRVAELGIPHVAVPLLRDGCNQTEFDLEELETLLFAQSAPPTVQTPSYLPLLRETVRIFDAAELPRLLQSYVHISESADSSLQTTEEIAVDWLRHGGKRLRPFITMAAYAVARYGADALATDNLPYLIPDEVRRVAVAIEIFHKASLVHDDIEDDDELRYGQPTIHARYGVPIAVNIGDFLIGLGYQLIAGAASGMEMKFSHDILRYLASVHLDLCRGQGAELLLQQQQDSLRPAAVLEIYALKTSPAFMMALYAGFRAAVFTIDPELLRQFALYIGEAFQVLNDLADWEEGRYGADALAQRPTILRAFALEAGAELPAGQSIAEVLAIYTETGAMDKAELLVEKLALRAHKLADGVSHLPTCELLHFLVRMIAGRANIAALDVQP